MQREVIFRDRQEFQAADPNNVQAFVRETFDNLIADTVGAGIYYSGFDCAATNTWELTVGSGRRYAGGELYRRATASVFDLFSDRPISQKKVVAIVAWGQTIETDVQPRDFLIDVDTGATEPQAVAMQRLRSAEVNKIVGAEAAQPQAPSIPADNVLVALVTIGTGGIETIAMHEGGLVPQAQRNFVLSLENAERLALAGASIDVLRTDLFGISRVMENLTPREQFVALDAEVDTIADRVQRLEVGHGSQEDEIGQLKIAVDAIRTSVNAHETRLDSLHAKVNELAAAASKPTIPAPPVVAPPPPVAEVPVPEKRYSLSHIDIFSNDRKSQTARADYRASISAGGLTFGGEQTVVTGGLRLLDPNDPKVTVVDNIVRVKQTPRLGLNGKTGALSSASLLGYTTTNITYKTVVEKTTSRVAKENMELAYANNAGTGAAGFPNFVEEAKARLRDGFTFKSAQGVIWTMTGYEVRRHALGHDVLYYQYVRYADEVTTKNTKVPTNVTETVTAQGRAQTFINPSAGLLTHIGLSWETIGASGDLRILVCECDGTVPDMDKVLSNTLFGHDQLRAGDRDYNIRNVDLKPGVRYGVVLLTTGDHRIRLAAGSRKLTQGQHYAVTGTNQYTVPAGEGANDIAMRLFFGASGVTRETVSLQSLTLAGGINSIEVDSRFVTPGQTSIVLEGQIGGEWQVIGSATGGARKPIDLSQLPPLIPLRIVLEGTFDQMPSFSIGALSTVRLGRASGAMKHISVPVVAEAGKTVRDVTILATLLNFDEATMDCDISLEVGGAVVSPASVRDRLDADGRIKRTATFKLAAPASSFTPIISGLATGARHFIVDQRFDQATE